MAGPSIALHINCHLPSFSLPFFLPTACLAGKVTRYPPYTYDRYLETAFAKKHWLLTWAHKLTKSRKKTWHFCHHFMSFSFTLSVSLSYIHFEIQDWLITSCEESHNAFLIMTRHLLTILWWWLTRHSCDQAVLQLCILLTPAPILPLLNLKLNSAPQRWADMLTPPPYST
jgi:hypothetical protein